MLRVRHVTAGEAAMLRELRLAALGADPRAFGATHAEEAARPAGWWEEWAAGSDSGADQRTFVAEDPDLGPCALARVGRSTRPGTAELHSMWVAPEARGRGTLRALCDAAGAWARHRGLHTLELGVMEANAGARAAYAAAGFAERGREDVRRGGRLLVHVRMTRPVS